MKLPKPKKKRGKKFMELKIEKKPKFVMVEISGRLVASCSEDLKEAVCREIEDCPNVLCDLSQMAHIDSSGLGVLVYILQKCRAAGGTCRLACLQSHPKIVFDITKVVRVFEIYDTLADAEKAFEQ